MLKLLTLTLWPSVSCLALVCTLAPTRLPLLMFLGRCHQKFSHSQVLHVKYAKLYVWLKLLQKCLGQAFLQKQERKTSLMQLKIFRNIVTAALG